MTLASPALDMLERVGNNRGGPTLERLGSSSFPERVDIILPDSDSAAPYSDPNV